MEKDYFRDRPNESKEFLSINGGDEVLICLKANQRTYSLRSKTSDQKTDLPASPSLQPWG